MSKTTSHLFEKIDDIEIEKIIDEVRGKNTFLSYGNLQLILVETNKGFSRGGHYHKTDTNHTLLSGTIHLLQKNLSTCHEIEKIFVAPATIPIPANCAHVLTAMTDTKLIEVFQNGYEDTVFPEYRKLVERRMEK